LKRKSLRRGSYEFARFDLALVQERGKHLQALGGDGSQEAHDVLNGNVVLDRQDCGERVPAHPQVATLGNPIGIEQVGAGVEVMEEELRRLLLGHGDAGVGEEFSGPTLDGDGVAAPQDALGAYPLPKASAVAVLTPRACRASRYSCTRQSVRRCRRSMEMMRADGGEQGCR
jgi:hypothetical protein